MEEDPKSLTTETTSCDDMPRDIIINILSWLPVKSLLRFRCVCKSWRASIGDSNFISMHLNQTSAHNNDCVLVHDGDLLHKFSLPRDETFVEHMELEIPFKNSLGSFVVKGHCNGLLCLSHRESLDFNNNRDIYLWNPATRECKALPLSPCGTFLRMHLAFGFVPQVNDYRVVKVIYYRDWKFSRRVSRPKVPPLVQIYSLSTDSWKRVRNVVPCLIHCSGPMDLVVNGVVHWVATKDTEENRYHEFILSFDMANEVFGEIKLPQSCHDVWVLHRSAKMLNELLSLFVYGEDGHKEQVDIWIMKEYGVVDSWTKQFTIDLWAEFLYPLAVLKNGEVMLKRVDGELALYDPRVQQVKDLRIHGVPESLDILTYYTESLVLLNEGNLAAGPSNLLVEDTCTGE